MALKPTIYKFKVGLSDLNREVYDALSLTLAMHPSESVERMMARVMAYCLNTQEFLSFTKGLSAIEEPDIWVRTLDDQLKLWIELGEPAVDRIKKAVGRSREVKVYSFNTKSDVWWVQNQEKFASLEITVCRFDYAKIKALGQLIGRTTEMSVMISGCSAYVTTDKGECEVVWEVLQSVVKG